MPNLTATPAARIALVRSVGAGIRKTDIAVDEILGAIQAVEEREGKTFDHKARGAVASLVHVWACGDATPPAVKTGAKGNQTATDYGRGHDTIVTAVKRALSTPPAKTESLTVTWIDADGTTHTRKIDAGAELFTDLTATLFGDDASE